MSGSFPRIQLLAVSLRVSLLVSVLPSFIEAQTAANAQVVVDRPALPPAFDTAISARLEQTRLAVAIPIDLTWGLP